MKKSGHLGVREGPRKDTRLDKLHPLTILVKIVLVAVP